MNIDALIKAVRSGDIQAAQAMLPDDPIVKRAREIAAKHFGEPCRYLNRELDDSPQVRAIVEALEEQDAVLRRCAE